MLVWVDRSLHFLQTRLLSVVFHNANLFLTKDWTSLSSYSYDSMNNISSVVFRKMFVCDPPVHQSAREAQGYTKERGDNRNAVVFAHPPTVMMIIYSALNCVAVIWIMIYSTAKRWMCDVCLLRSGKDWCPFSLSVGMHKWWTEQQIPWDLRTEWFEKGIDPRKGETCRTSVPN